MKSVKVTFLSNELVKFHNYLQLMWKGFELRSILHVIETYDVNVYKKIN